MSIELTTCPACNKQYSDILCEIRCPFCGKEKNVPLRDATPPETKDIPREEAGTHE